MIKLPNTLRQYYQAIQKHELDPVAAFKKQSTNFKKLAKTNLCVVDIYDTQPVANLPFSGAALAHKDIFEQNNRSPGLGLRRGITSKRSVQAAALHRLALAGFADLGALSMSPQACSSVAQDVLTAANKKQTCLNPLNPKWVVGGSSSGSAVAVASGAIYGSLGTDTAGSVRIPAFTCGVMGLKPTQSLIRKVGMVGLCPSLDTIGILTRSAYDIDILLESVMCRNRLVASALRPDSLRVTGWVPETANTGHLDALDENISNILKSFHKDFNHTLKYNALEFEASATIMQSVMMNTEVGLTHLKSLQQNRATPEVTALGLLGLTQPAEWYAYATNQRSEYLERFIQAHFQSADIVITPAYAHSIPDAAEVTLGNTQFSLQKRLALHRYTSFVNYLGLPALVMPITKDSNGRPVSIQLICKPFHERTLIAYATHLENLIFGDKGILPTYFLSGHT
jgi:aspartyl-tRNA(Asn)/glutamyl-tRNA(Gln) amidotransferase subunit A